MSLEALSFSNGQGVAQAQPQVPVAAAPPPGVGSMSIGQPSQQPDIAQQLIEAINKPVDLKAATSLVPGQHQTQMPSSLSRQIGPAAQAPLIPQGVGAHHAKQVGIGNAILGVGNALSSIVTAEAEHKQGQVRDGATKAITAQSNIDEATQALNDAKANGDTESALRYQKVIDENQKAMTQVFSDPKLRKSLVKGFNISYTDPTANKTEEHQAVQEAMKAAKTLQEKKQIAKDFQAKQQAAAGQAAAAAFTKQQPQGLTPNVQAIQRVNMEMGQKKFQQEALKDILTFRAKQNETAARLDLGHQRIVEAGILKQAQFEHAQNMLDQRIAQEEKMRGERFADSLKLISAHGAEARKTAAAIRADTNANPYTIWSKTRKTAEEYQKAFLSGMNELDVLKNERLSMYVNAKGGKLTPNEKDVQDIDMRIKLVSDQVNLFKQNAENFTQSANAMQSGYGFSGGVDDGGASTDDDSGADGSSTGSTLDLTDPESYATH